MEQVYPYFTKAAQAAIRLAMAEHRDYVVYEDLTEEAFYVRNLGFSRPAGSKRVFTTDWRKASQDARQTAFEQEQAPDAREALDPPLRAKKPSQTTADKNLREGRNVLDRLANAIERTGILFTRSFDTKDATVDISLTPQDWRRIYAIAAAMNNLTAPLSE